LATAVKKRTQPLPIRARARAKTSNNRQIPYLPRDMVMAAGHHGKNLVSLLRGGKLGATLPAEAGLGLFRLFKNLQGVEILRQAAEGCQF